MPSMSYCMFENTSTEMRQVLNKMRAIVEIEDLDMSEYEQRAFRDLYEQCQEYVVRYRELATDFLQTEESSVWDSKNWYFNALQEHNKFTSIWSMYEIDDIHGYSDIIVEEDSVLLHQNVSVKLPAGKLTWFELWKFADEAIVNSRDQHHIFIESFTQSSINSKIILLGTGS